MIRGKMMSGFIRISGSGIASTDLQVYFNTHFVKSHGFKKEF